jgi:CPA1 family monovalent cation:H+ antiporter
LFILVGMSVRLSSIWDNIWLIIAGILCLWLARALMIFIIGRIMNRKQKELPFRWQMTMWWGGLRGAIPIAMVLSIPTTLIILDSGGNSIDFPYQEEITAATFGVVLGTLLIQGFTLRPMLRRLGFYGVSKKDAEKEEREISALLQDTMGELKTLEEDGELSEQGYNWLTTRFGLINSQLITEMGALVQEHGFIPKEEYIFTVHEALEHKKKAISDAWARNLISGSTGEKLIFEIESQIAALTSETAEEQLRTPVEILRSVTGTEVAAIERSCGICMDTIGPGQSVIKCRCGTLFHLSCLQNIDRCPICIAILEKPNAGG